VDRNPRRSTILIVCDNEMDRETLRVYVGTMGYPWLLAWSFPEAVEMLNKESVCAAILDSRCMSSGLGQEDCRLREILLALPGRVLVLTNEDLNVPAGEIAKRYSLPIVKLERVTQDLWDCLERLLHPPPAFQAIAEISHLILDTFLQPVPAGIRDSHSNVRQLLYESKSFTTDISLEPVKDTASFLLAGQILSRTATQRPLSGSRVVFEGPKGILGSTMTNEWGEFSFELPNGSKITLEIEVSPNQRLRINSPTLQFSEKDESKPADQSSSSEISGQPGNKYLRHRTSRGRS
jgi:CheY-like chemotaxis protein